MSVEVYHVLPVNDIYEYKESSWCDCSPKTEEHGGNKLVIHNSFDNREENEKNIN